MGASATENCVMAAPPGRVRAHQIRVCYRARKLGIQGLEVSALGLGLHGHEPVLWLGR